MKTVLVVDDEVEVAKALRRLLRGDFQVKVACSGAEALVLLADGPVDLVLSDFRMPGMNGAELLAEVRRRMPLALRIILSGFADLDSVLASVNDGEICRFIKKPWDDAELISTLHRLLAGQDMLAQLYNPFRSLQPGATADTAQDSDKVSVRVRMARGAFGREQALCLIRKFLGAIHESELELVGGLLQQHSGKLSFVAEVGGEQQLTLELSTGATAGPKEPEEPPC